MTAFGSIVSLELMYDLNTRQLLESTVPAVTCGPTKHCTYAEQFHNVEL